MEKYTESLPLHRACCYIHFISNQLMHLFQNTFTFTFIKTLKLVKNVLYKRHLKNPTCFGPYSMSIFSGRSSYLVHLPPFGCLPRHLSFRYVAVCRLCPVYLFVGCLQTTHRQVYRTHRRHTATYRKDKWPRQPTDRYTGHIDGIRPHTEKTNDEAGSRRVVDALSTKNDHWRWS
jgi:hypothetical protein